MSGLDKQVSSRAQDHSLLQNSKNIWRFSIAIFIAYNEMYSFHSFTIFFLEVQWPLGSKPLKSSLKPLSVIRHLK